MSNEDPRGLGFAMPAEWEAHRGVFVAAPHLTDEWGGHFEAAREEWVAMVRALAEVAGERVVALVADAETEAFCRASIASIAGVHLERTPYGDAWVRDTAPIGLVRRSPPQRGAPTVDDDLACVRFAFNGWGGKYAMAGDADVGDAIAGLWPGPCFRRSIVLEGGAIEVDGEGTLLTSESSLLEPNRNPGLERSALEDELRRAFGVERIGWLRRGLANDHTDGHVDTLARFVAPGKVVCMATDDPDDPNREVLDEIAADLADMEDAKGRRLEVTRIPSPGFIPDDEGRPLPASYCNFYIGNRAVVVPTYDVRSDLAAIEGLSDLFEGRKVIGRSARAIVTGGGAFHCMTQQLPGREP